MGFQTFKERSTKLKIVFVLKHCRKRIGLLLYDSQSCVVLALPEAYSLVQEIEISLP